MENKVTEQVAVGGVRTAETAHQPSDGVGRTGELDRITLTGLRARGHHGVFDFERRDGQEFVVDLVCWLDLAPAGTSDDLAHTVDYGALANAVISDIVGDPVQLIETLAEKIARTCLTDPRVAVVEVTVHKPQAPIEVPFGDVAVTVRRSTQR